MGMIDRYRKKGGFLQLVQLIETTPSPKQEKFLKLIAEESHVWEEEIKKKMLSMDRIVGWDTSILGEIFPHIQPLTLAAAIQVLNDEKKSKVLGILTNSEKRKMEDHLVNSKTASAGEIFTSVTRIFDEVRKMIASNHLKLDKFDPELIIPEDIEERLGKPTGSGQTSQSSKKDTSISVAQDSGSSPDSMSNDDEPGANLDFSLAFETPSPKVTKQAVEEIAQLRKKVITLNHELTRVQNENKVMKEKLEQIKKIA